MDDHRPLGGTESGLQAGSSPHLALTRPDGPCAGWTSVVGVEQGVGSVRLHQLGVGDRMGQPVVRRPGELQHPARNRDGDPVTGRRRTIESSGREPLKSSVRPSPSSADASPRSRGFACVAARTVGLWGASPLRDFTSRANAHSGLILLVLQVLPVSAWVSRGSIASTRNRGSAGRDLAGRFPNRRPRPRLSPGVTNGGGLGNKQEAGLGSTTNAICGLGRTSRVTECRGNSNERIRSFCSLFCFARVRHKQWMRKP